MTGKVMMVNRLKWLVAGLCVVLFVSSPMADTLELDIYPQGNSSWCWAAAAQALCSYYDEKFDKSLTEVASVYTTDKSKYPPLDQLGEVLQEVVEENGSAINMKTVFKPGQISWSEYKKEIDENRTFIFVIKWDVAGMYHNNVAIGYIGDSTMLYYMDPGNNDKRWRTWKEITGINTIKSGNTKKGTWFGSLLVTSPTPVSNEVFNARAILKRHTTQAKNNGFVTLHFNSPVVSSAAVRIFNLRGACVYEMTSPTGFNHAYFQVPYQFTAGNYVVSLTQNTMSDLPHEAAGVFSIVK